MIRKLVFLPGWDKHDSGLGVNCLDMNFLVLGERGITEFQLCTNWYPESVMVRRLEWLKKDIWDGKQDFLIRHFIEPFPADVCYYSLSRMNEDDTYFETGVQHIFDHRPCYYGYKFMDEVQNKMAKDVAYQKLIEHGDDAVYEYLEEYHKEIFGG